MHGKWATHWQECDIKHSPDYCSGWAYVVTPKLGLRLAEVAANVAPGKICLRLEDLFITGMLRERIEGMHFASMKYYIPPFLYSLHPTLIQAPV